MPPPSESHPRDNYPSSTILVPLLFLKIFFPLDIYQMFLRSFIFVSHILMQLGFISNFLSYSVHNLAPIPSVCSVQSGTFTSFLS